MSEEFAKTSEQIAAFQKIWTESYTQLMRTAFTAAPHSAPPEILRQIRSGILKSLAESWEEFLRSPQFLDGMRQWMDSAISFRKMSNDWMARVRNELQAPSREDIDTIMLSVRHMEQRLLNRMEELAKRIEASNGQTAESRSRAGVSKTGRVLQNKSRSRTSPRNQKGNKK
jgi:hypothetical protein